MLLYLPYLTNYPIYPSFLTKLCLLLSRTLSSYNKVEVVILKMLTTQISGLLQRIAGNGEESIEETARLLAQATIGEGRVIIAGFGEMEAVTATALHGAEPLNGAVRYEIGMDITTADRIWLLTRSAMDEPALELARQLAEALHSFCCTRR